MAGSVNKVILIGNLGRDPEIRHGQDGSKIVNLNVATSESWKDKSSGERKEKTEWHRVVVFNDRIGDLAERYLKKGSKVYIEGALQTRKWADKDGSERYSTEVVISRFKGELTMLDGPNNGSGRQGGAQDDPYAGDHSYNAPIPAASAKKAPAGGGGGWEPPPDLDDEIPFLQMGDDLDLLLGRKSIYRVP